MALLYGRAWETVYSLGSHSLAHPHPHPLPRWIQFESLNERALYPAHVSERTAYRSESNSSCVPGACQQLSSEARDPDRAGHAHKRHHVDERDEFEFELLHGSSERDERGEDELPGTFIPLHTFDVQMDSSMGGRPATVVGLCTLVSITESSMGGTVVGLWILVSVVSSIEKMAMSVALLPMSQKYGWSDSVKGAISSAFSAGHIVSNLYGGVLAASHSPKAVLAGGILLWSIFVLITPFVAPWLSLLLFARAIMGVGEGVAIPTMQLIIKGSVPTEKRGQALSLVYSGHSIGSIISLLVTPFVLDSGGTVSLFLLYGFMGLLLLFTWEHAMVGASWARQRKVLEGPVVVSPKGAEASGAKKTDAPTSLMNLPWKTFVSNKTFWAVMMAHITFGIGINMCVAWLPTYYSQEFQLDLKKSSFLGILPWIMMASGSNVSGILADFLIKRKSSASVSEAVALITICMSAMGMQAGGFASVHTDISTKYAPVLFGITNAASSLAGCIFVYLVGIILDHLGSWPLRAFCRVTDSPRVRCKVMSAQVSSNNPFVKDADGERERGRRMCTRVYISGDVVSRGVTSVVTWSFGGGR
eukprot:gene23753-9314_t